MRAIDSLKLLRSGTRIRHTDANLVCCSLIFCIDCLLGSIANQANSRLADDDKISVSPHVLRHTALHKWTEKKGVRFAQKIAGHASDRYIWRYITPSDGEVDQAVDELWD